MSVAPRGCIILVKRFGASTEDEAVRHLIIVAEKLLAPALRGPDRPSKRVPLRQGRGIFSIIGGLVIAGLYLPLTLDCARATERTVDLELVLAADISGSMDVEEAALQRQGFANAIRHPKVIATIQAGPLGRIAVTYVEWASEHIQSTLVHWTEISDTESARAFADAIEQPTVRIEEWTSISALIARAARSFEGNRFQGRRQIIDISGDGPNNRGAYVVHARDRAVADGITINGLPIVNDRPSPYGFPPLPDLDLYYEDCVIGGHGSFIVVADGFQDFARAIRQKMLLEIIAGAAPLVPLVRLASNRVRPTCDAGERQLPGWMFDFN